MHCEIYCTITIVSNKSTLMRNSYNYLFIRFLSWQKAAWKQASTDQILLHSCKHFTYIFVKNNIHFLKTIWIT